MGGVDISDRGDRSVTCFDPGVFFFDAPRFDALPLQSSCIVNLYCHIVWVFWEAMSLQPL